MNGKKAAIIVVSIVIVVVILIFIAFKTFFATYEPKNSVDELSFGLTEEVKKTHLS